MLALSLSHDPATNRLYKMVKGNILPMGGMLAAHAAGQAATDAARSGSLTNSPTGVVTGTPVAPFPGR